MTPGISYKVRPLLSVSCKCITDPRQFPRYTDSRVLFLSSRYNNSCGLIACAFMPCRGILRLISRKGRQQIYPKSRSESGGDLLGFEGRRHALATTFRLSRGFKSCCFSPRFFSRLGCLRSQDFQSEPACSLKKLTKLGRFFRTFDRTVQPTPNFLLACGSYILL